MNQILFVTDGEPNSGESNTDQIILNVKNANNISDIDKYSNKISIFSFGVGTDGNDESWIQDLNHSFLKLISLNNNGIYKRIKQSNCDTILNEFYQILSKPVLSNVNVQYNDNKNAQITNLTATKFDCLYFGNDLIICGKMQSQQKEKSLLHMTVSISAITGKQINNNMVEPIEINKTMQVAVIQTKSNNAQRIWAYLKLQQSARNQLIEDMIEQDEDEKNESLQIAMKYKFVTPWTSMIVVKHKHKRKDKQNKEQIHELKSNNNEINKYDEKMNNNEQMIIQLKKQMQRTTGAAKNTYKQKALKLLKQQKQYQQQRNTVMNQQMNIDSVKFAMESIRDNAQMVSAMKCSAAQLKQINIDDIDDDLCDEMQDLMNDSNEINEILGQAWGMDDFDEDDLLDELDGLDDELDDLDINHDDEIPSYMRISGATNTNALNDNIDEYGLPKVPEPIITESKRSEIKQKLGCVAIIDEMLSSLFDDKIMVLDKCSVSDMIQLIHVIIDMINDLVQYKTIICQYFAKQQIDGKLFILLVQKNDFVQNLLVYVQSNNEWIAINLLHQFKQTILNFDFKQHQIGQIKANR